MGLDTPACVGTAPQRTQTGARSVEENRVEHAAPERGRCAVGDNHSDSVRFEFRTATEPLGILPDQPSSAEPEVSGDHRCSTTGDLCRFAALSGRHQGRDSLRAEVLHVAVLAALQSRRQVHRPHGVIGLLVAEVLSQTRDHPVRIAERHRVVRVGDARGVCGRNLSQHGID